MCQDLGLKRQIINKSTNLAIIAKELKIKLSIHWYSYPYPYIHIDTYQPEGQGNLFIFFEFLYTRDKFLSSHDKVVAKY